MDKIREQLNKPLVAGGIGLVIGILFGWFALGWGAFPVQWTDASPALLRQDAKVDYLRMAIDSYNLNKNIPLAQQRWNELGEGADGLLAIIQTSPNAPTGIENFRAVVAGPATAGTALAPQTTLTPAGTAAPGKLKSSGLTLILSILCILLLAIAGALVYIFVFRNRKQGGAAPTSPMMGETSRQPATMAEFAETSKEETPVSQFMSTYVIGDDLYDDSFSIDSPSGEFLGECGVGISDTIGVGDPKKVTAFEVWLFDKNDIQTITQVVMSPHAFNDPAIRQKLESKGEPVLVEPGKRILLETATLQLQARIVDMNYGQGALPQSSFFDRMTLELAVWPKTTKPQA